MFKPYFNKMVVAHGVASNPEYTSPQNCDFESAAPPLWGYKLDLTIYTDSPQNPDSERAAVAAAGRPGHGRRCRWSALGIGIFRTGFEFRICLMRRPCNRSPDNLRIRFSLSSPHHRDLESAAAAAAGRPGHHHHHARLMEGVARFGSDLGSGLNRQPPESAFDHVAALGGSASQR